MNLRATPVGREPQLAGRWQLQTPQREALATSYRTLMEQSQAKQEAEFHKQRQRMQARGDADIRLPEPDAPPAREAGDESPNNNGPRRSNWRMREQHEQNEALLNAVLPHTQLHISQTAQRIDVVPDHGARRSFDVGQTSTLVSTFSTLHIESGWQGNVFVVHSRDSEQGIDIVERYQRMSDALQLQVQFKSADIKKQIYTATYELLH